MAQRTFIIALICATSALHAADDPAQQAQRMSDQQYREQQQARTQNPLTPIRGIDLPTASVAIDVSEPRCFDIQTISLISPDGLPLSDRWLAYKRTAQSFAKQCFGAKAINQLVQAMTASFVGNGWVTTRVGVPKQNLSDGGLKLAVVFGRLEQVETSKDLALSRWDLALPIRPGDVINLRDIEQAVDQIERLKSQKAKIDIVPGEKPGTASLALNIIPAKTRVQGHFALDNHGAESTGKTPATASVTIDNVVGVSDVWKTTASRSLGGQGKAESTSVSMSVPFGYSTVSAEAGSQQSQRTINGAFEQFISRSESENWSFGLDRMIYRDAKTQFKVSLDRAQRVSRSYVDDTEIQIQARDQVSENWNATLKHQTDNGQYQLSYSVSKGRPGWGGQDDPVDLREGEATRRYRVDKLDWTYNRRFPNADSKQPELSWETRFNLQRSEDDLLGTEMASIGSPYTVRGFEGANSLVAQNAWYLQNKFSIPLGPAKTQTWAAFDVGKVYGSGTEDLPGKSLAGMSVGQSTDLGQFSYDWSVAVPLHAPSHLQSRDPVLRASMKWKFE